MASELGRVLDRDALDEEGGARGRLRITVPSRWLDASGELAIVAPARLPCARCDGGGCDGCGRSGVVRAPLDAGERTITVWLPATAGEGVALRIARPFGDEATITQLLLEVRVGAAASPGVTRTEAPLDLRAPSSSELWAPAHVRPIAWSTALALVIATAGAILFGLFGR